MRALSRLILVCLMGCGASSEGTPAAGGSSMEVVGGPLVYSTSFFGEVEARESVPIHAPNVSLVDAFTVESVLPDGSAVREGDVVLSFVRGPVEDELRSRKADLDVVEAEMRREMRRLDKQRIGLELAAELATMRVREAELQLAAKRELAARVEQDKAVVDLQKAEVDLQSAKEVLVAFSEERRTAIEVKELAVRRAQVEHDEAAMLLETLDVRAPADGTVYAPYTTLNWARSKVRPGSVVRPGDKLLEIPDLDAFVAQLYVRQREAPQIAVGDGMIVTAEVAPDHPMVGRVTGIEEFATTRNERLGTETPQGALKEVRVTVALEGAAERLRPGATVRADHEKTLVERAVLVPLAAIAESDGQPHVTVVGRGTVPIEFGASSTSQVEVLHGVAVGERVLLGSPHQSVRRPNAGAADERETE